MRNSLKNIAFIVGIGTIASKSAGLVRQLVIAGTFGIGAAYDAYNYAYVIPGFFLILLGGINGPFHNSMVSVLSRRTEKESSYILASIRSLICCALFLISILLIIYANIIIKSISPGLSNEIQNIAAIQLRIMSPIVFFSGLIGIGFGALNAKNEFLIPVISPIISSIVIIIFSVIFWLRINPEINANQIGLNGGILIAVATLIGTILQWLIQIPRLIKKGLSNSSFIWDLDHPGVKEVLKVIWPATLSSGMLQVNVFSDLFFASNFAGAAASLGYANFLIQAPLGIASNTLLIPILPNISRLTEKKDRDKLINRIGQSIMIASASMIALGIIFITLGDQIVSLTYKRGAFDVNAVKTVSGLLLAYGLGMPVYLIRDLLVRVYYAIGKAELPFKISTICIFMNILFDWILIGAPIFNEQTLPFNLGVKGIVLSTVLVNLIASLLLLSGLKYYIGNLPYKKWFYDETKLILSGIISALFIVLIKSIITWPSDLISMAIILTLISSISCIIFSATGDYLGVKEIKDLIKIIKIKLNIN